MATEITTATQPQNSRALHPSLLKTDQSSLKSLGFFEEMLGTEEAENGLKYKLGTLYVTNSVSFFVKILAFADKGKLINLISLDFGKAFDLTLPR